MKRTQIESTNLISIGYDPSARILEIEFKSTGIYSYQNVPPEEYARLMNSESIGKYFSENIKDNYPIAKTAEIEKLGYKKIKLLGGSEVTVDFRARKTSCRGCDKLIRFGVTKNNKLMPIIQVGDDWQAHFADCEKADKFRKTNEEELSNL